MGIDYKFFRAYIVKFKCESVTKTELKQFLAEHPEYQWDESQKVIYLKSTYHVYFNDRLSYYRRLHQGDRNYVEQDDGSYFIGMKPLDVDETVPDIKESDLTALIENFYGRVEIIGWSQIGYTH